MSDPENFLTRWSRRKLEAEQTKDEPGPQSQAEAPAVAEPAEIAVAKSPLDAAVEKREEPEFDVSTLPSIDSITSATDVRAFLQKGVPADLARAALRRAWTADPAIRDFIGIAENQFDFASGSDIPGFGPLNVGTDEIRRMVADVFGERLSPSAEAPAQSAPEVPQKSPPQAVATEEPASSQDVASTEAQPASETSGASTAEDVVRRSEVNIAMQQSNHEQQYEEQPARRLHGRALPQ